MLPRNLTFFRFNMALGDYLAQQTGDLTILASFIEQNRFRDIGPQEFSTSGFVPVLGYDFTISSADYEGFALRIAEKLLPGASIREAVAKKCDIVESLEGRKPDAKERKRIKDDVINEMLPHAPVRLKTIRGWFDYAEGWLVIDTASRKQAEYVLTQLRQALGSLPAVPLIPEESPRVTLTQWLLCGMPMELPYQIDSECQLRDPATSNGARVTFVRQDLETDEVIDHARAGKQVYRLGIVFDERASMVLDSDLVVRKLKLTDVALDSLTGAYADESPAQADFALVTLEVSRLCASLARVFKVPRP